MHCFLYRQLIKVIVLLLKNKCFITRKNFISVRTHKVSCVVIILTNRALFFSGFFSSFSHFNYILLNALYPSYPGQQERGYSAVYP